MGFNGFYKLVKTKCSSYHQNVRGTRIEIIFFTIHLSKSPVDLLISMRPWEEVAVRGVIDYSVDIIFPSEAISDHSTQEPERGSWFCLIEL